MIMILIMIMIMIMIMIIMFVTIDRLVRLDQHSYPRGSPTVK